jgi:hypothetical protein
MEIIRHLLFTQFSAVGSKLYSRRTMMSAQGMSVLKTINPLCSLNKLPKSYASAGRQRQFTAADLIASLAVALSVPHFSC